MTNSIVDRLEKLVCIRGNDRAGGDLFFYGDVRKTNDLLV